MRREAVAEYSRARSWSGFLRTSGRRNRLATREERNDQRRTPSQDESLIISQFGAARKCDVGVREQELS